MLKRNKPFAALIAALCSAAALAAPPDPDEITRGAYLARAGDCVACHSAPGEAPFAGGLPLDMPYLGRVYSTNITPHPENGIGRYSFEDFDAAMRHGVTPDGRRLYPAMPYPSYARITEADMRALYAYFMHGVAPAARVNNDDEIPWYLAPRWPLGVWSWLFADAEPFTPDPTQDAAWNRGAYLVEGLGHCGACHTPRGMALQEKALSSGDGGSFLAGSHVGGWYAKSLRGEADQGLGTWSVDEIVQLLKTGRTQRAAAFGAMTEVIAHSTQYMTDNDLYAMAQYLKSLPATDGSDTAAQTATLRDDGTLGDLLNGVNTRRGAQVYVEFCAGCHRFDGLGAPRVFPALAGNPSVLSDDTRSLIRVVLEGGRMASTRHDPMAFAMPALHELSDREVADVLDFVRNSWGNQAAPLDIRDVARQRAQTQPTATAQTGAAGARHD